MDPGPGDGPPFLIEDAAARGGDFGGFAVYPGPPELAADATDKASKVAREQSAARAAAKVAKQGQASQNAPLPAGARGGRLGAGAGDAGDSERGARAAGGLAAALAAASPTAAQDARRAAAQQQATQQQMVQQQQAMMQQVMAMGTSPMAMAAAAAGAGGFPVGTPTGGGHFAPGSFTGTPGSSFGGALAGLCRTGCLRTRSTARLYIRCTSVSRRRARRCPRSGSPPGCSTRRRRRRRRPCSCRRSSRGTPRARRSTGLGSATPWRRRSSARRRAATALPGDRGRGREVSGGSTTRASWASRRARANRG